NHSPNQFQPAPFGGQTITSGSITYERTNRAARLPTETTRSDRPTAGLSLDASVRPYASLSNRAISS
ncbi:MAG: hypothetical protein VXB09_01685, partial [Gammaproteobacteria bacterium]